jgi:predicted alpha/beta superfamily hydrolase
MRLLLSLCCALAIHAQAPPAATFAPVVSGLVLPDVESSEFHSRFTGHDYHVYVALPAGYRQSARRYPVLYAPDYDGVFFGLRAAGFLMNFGNMLEDFILVGVPLKSENMDDWARKRTFDLTPTEDAALNASSSKQYHAEVRSGGAPMFLRTLREELIPFIESKYRVTSDRGLAGYSYGGLFAAWVLLNGGDAFSRYLIGSPSLWWDNGTILKSEAAAKSGKSLRGRVFLSVGADEGPLMVDPFRRLTAALTTHAYPDLRVESHIFEDTDHLSGALASMSRGLKILYARR